VGRARLRSGRYIVYGWYGHRHYREGCRGGERVEMEKEPVAVLREAYVDSRAAWGGVGVELSG
jgi:hypothetical protein